MKAMFQGKEVETIEVDVLTKDEHFNTYQLSDGNILMFEEVLTGIQRLEGMFNPDGAPIYQFQTSKVVRVKTVK